MTLEQFMRTLCSSLQYGLYKDNLTFFKTDDLGRDILSRLIYGSRVSILLDFCCFSFLTLGTFLGLISGFMVVKRSFYYGVIDVIMSFPSILLALWLLLFLVRNKMLFYSSIVSIPGFTRIINQQSL